MISSSPPLLYELGLKSALRLYVDGYSTHSKIKVNLTIPADLARFPADMKIACFRIVQECLTNGRRHSKSATAMINISHGEVRLLVEVRDKGVGMAPQRHSESLSGGSGVGLAGIRERVRQLGGTLKIKSDVHTEPTYLSPCCSNIVLAQAFAIYAALGCFCHAVNGMGDLHMGA